MSAAYPAPIEQDGSGLVINVHEDGALALIPFTVTALGQVINLAGRTMMFRVKQNAFAVALGAHPTDPMGRSLALTKANVAMISDNAGWVIFDETDPAMPVDHGKGVLRKYR
jgi:hypothetical protein